MYKFDTFKLTVNTFICIRKVHYFGRSWVPNTHVRHGPRGVMFNDNNIILCNMLIKSNMIKGSIIKLG